MEMMMKNIQCLLTICMFVFFFTGCGESPLENLRADQARLIRLYKQGDYKEFLEGMNEPDVVRVMKSMGHFDGMVKLAKEGKFDFMLNMLEDTISKEPNFNAEYTKASFDTEEFGPIIFKKCGKHWCLSVSDMKENPTN